MKVTLLGHASVLAELHGRTVLIDPVFRDPFGEAAIVSCPSRQIHLEQLPRVDLLVISNGNLDHLDVATLAELPRECIVVCPNDPAILYALDKLGFRSVRPTMANTLLKLGKYELLTTPTASTDNEFGVVLKDRSGTFWHQVDTILSGPIIDQVRAQVGKINLLFAAYATQSFSYFGSQRGGYPTQAINGFVQSARRVDPTLVVPASAGFRLTGPFAWANRFVFPISRERFLSDLARAAPTLASTIANPGDVFEIGNDKVTRHPAASPVATMIEDDTHLIDFDPTAEVPKLTDPNREGYPVDLIEQHVLQCFDGLTRFVRERYASSEPLIADHRRHGGSYGIGVVFPDGHERWLRFHFEANEPRIERGEGPIRGALSVHRIPASVITARLRFECTYDFSLSRLSMTSPASLINGKVVIDAREPSDLLAYYLRRKAPGAEDSVVRNLDFRLAPFIKC